MSYLWWLRSKNWGFCTCLNSIRLVHFVIIHNALKEEAFSFLALFLLILCWWCGASYSYYCSIWQGLILYWILPYYWCWVHILHWGTSNSWFLWCIIIIIIVLATLRFLRSYCFNWGIHLLILDLWLYWILWSHSSIWSHRWINGFLFLIRWILWIARSSSIWRRIDFIIFYMWRIHFIFYLWTVSIFWLWNYIYSSLYLVS